MTERANIIVRVLLSVIVVLLTWGALMSGVWWVAAHAAEIISTPGMRPTVRGPHSEWFEGLRQNAPPHGQCCGEADCLRVQARVVAGHYEVFHRGAWQKVPDEVILPRQDNPTGEPVACFHATGGYIMCFVKGFEA